MKLTAITMVKDEADVIFRTLRHLADQGVDEILLYENGSADGTWEIVRDLRDTNTLAPCHLVVYPDEEPGYWQSLKMTRLAAYALEGGADWIVPFDADEIWTAPAHRDLHDLFENVPGDIGVLSFDLFNHYRTLIDPGGHPFDAMVWRGPDPLPLPKVAFRAYAGATVEAGNHGVSGIPGHRARAFGAAIHHFPYRSPAQFLSKVRNGAAAYAATDLPRSTGQHWREMGETLKRHGEEGLLNWYEAFTYADPQGEGLIYDPLPHAD